MQRLGMAPVKPRTGGVEQMGRALPPRPAKGVHGSRGGGGDGDWGDGLARAESPRVFRALEAARE